MSGKLSCDTKRVERYRRRGLEYVVSGDVVDGTGAHPYFVIALKTMSFLGIHNLEDVNHLYRSYLKYQTVI